MKARTERYLILVFEKDVTFLDVVVGVEIGLKLLPGVSHSDGAGLLNHQEVRNGLSSYDSPGGMVFQ